MSLLRPSCESLVSKLCDKNNRSGSAGLPCLSRRRRSAAGCGSRFRGKCVVRVDVRIVRASSRPSHDFSPLRQLTGILLKATHQRRFSVQRRTFSAFAALGLPVAVRNSHSSAPLPPLPHLRGGAWCCVVSAWWLCVVNTQLAADTLDTLDTQNRGGGGVRGGVLRVCGPTVRTVRTVRRRHPAADRREGRAQGLRLYRARPLPSLRDADRLQPLSRPLRRSLPRSRHETGCRLPEHRPGRPAALSILQSVGVLRPSTSTASGQIADRLHVSVDWLLGRSDVMELPKDRKASAPKGHTRCWGCRAKTICGALARPNSSPCVRASTPASKVISGASACTASAAACFGTCGFASLTSACRDRSSIVALRHARTAAR